MSLTDRLDIGPEPPMHGSPCSVGLLLSALPPAEATALQHMLDTGWTARQIYDAVTGEGHMVGMQSINRHRREVCRCFL